MPREGRARHSPSGRAGAGATSAGRQVPWGLASAHCHQSCGSHCVDLSKVETSSDLPSIKVSRDGSGSSQGTFHKITRTTEGRKVLSGRTRVLSGVSNWVSHSAIYQGKLKGKSSGERTGIPSLGTDFSIKCKQRESIDKRDLIGRSAISMAPTIQTEISIDEMM